MDSKHTDFYPFYDPLRNGTTLSVSSKVGISLSLGAFYILLQYHALSDKMAFFQQYCWILGIIISTSILALYIATEVFRRSLVIINGFQGNSVLSDEVIGFWLNTRMFLIFGLSFATVNTSVAHLLGIPAEFHASALSLGAMYLGFFMAGFSAGVGLVSIFAVIILYLKFAPGLQHALDPQDPDGNGGLKKLGDSLWFFGMLIGVVGILISIYMFGVDWEKMYKSYARSIFLFWVALPYIVAISVVLIPGLAVRRQVSYYKSYMTDQLKQEKAKLYSSFKEFKDGGDDDIIASKKEINEKLDHIHEQMEKLRKMRNSPIDGK